MHNYGWVYSIAMYLSASVNNFEMILLDMLGSIFMQLAQDDPWVEDKRDVRDFGVKGSNLRIKQGHSWNTLKTHLHLQFSI